MGLFWVSEFALFLFAAAMNFLDWQVLEGIFGTRLESRLCLPSF